MTNAGIIDEIGVVEKVNELLGMFKSVNFLDEIEYCGRAK